MGCLLPIFAFLSIAIAVTHASSPSLLYWKTALPGTLMPSAIQDLIDAEALDQKAATPASVAKGGVEVKAAKGKPGGTTVGVGKGGVRVKAGGTGVSVGKGGVSVGVGGKGRTGVSVGKGGVGVVTGPKKKKPVAPKSPFFYNYAAAEDQIHDDPTVALFFLEEDLRPGHKLNLYFTKTTTGIGFLPRRTANSIPFSSSHLPEILSRFSIEPNSLEAEGIEQTLQDCEATPAMGETRHCATSLESMVDFSTSILGTRQVRPVSTTVENDETPEQVYTIASAGVEMLAGDKAVACHAQTYAYAVFNCHLTGNTRAYMVPLVGKDGTKAEAVAVCHKDTSAWNPKHVAFQVLEVKPGAVPICHFLPQDHVLWTYQ